MKLFNMGLGEWAFGISAGLFIGALLILGLS